MQAKSYMEASRKPLDQTMPLCHFWGICTLQDVLLLLLILCNLQPTHSCSVSDTFGSAHQLGSTSTKSLPSVELHQSALTMWPKAVTTSLMSIVTILLLLALHICDIPASRHHSLFYFWFLLHMVKCLGILVQFDMLWKCQMAQSHTVSTTPAACREASS